MKKSKICAGKPSDQRHFTLIGVIEYIFNRCRSSIDVVWISKIGNSALKERCLCILFLPNF